MTMKANIGFEWGTILEDANFSMGGTTALSTTQKRQGAYSLKFPASTGATWSNWAKLAFSAALAEFYLQFALYPDPNALTQLSPFFAWRNGTTILGGLQANGTSGMIEIWLGNFATKLGEFPYTVSAFQVIELRVKIADAGGVIQVRKDMGALAVDFSGDTQPGAAANVDNVYWGQLYGGGSVPAIYIDDIILNDIAGTRNNSWPGGLRIIRLAPSADGATLQFTPTPGPGHYSAVDEVPPVATDKLVAASAALVDELALADCPGDVQTIAAAQLMAFGLKGSSNPPTRLALGLKMTGGDHLTANLDLAVSQAVAKELWEESPDNPGNPLTVSEINNSQLILKSAA